MAKFTYGKVKEKKAAIDKAARVIVSAEKMYFEMSAAEKAKIWKGSKKKLKATGVSIERENSACVCIGFQATEGVTYSSEKATMSV